MSRKNKTDSPADSSVESQQSAEQQPTDGGSYTRCADSGELTLVERTSHEALPDETTIDFESTAN